MWSSVLLQLLKVIYRFEDGASSDVMRNYNCSGKENNFVDGGFNIILK